MYDDLLQRYTIMELVKLGFLLKEENYENNHYWTVAKSFVQNQPKDNK